MNQKFIVAIQKHNVLGYITKSYIIKPRNNSIYDIISSITLDDVNKNSTHYSDKQTELIGIIENLSLSNIYKIFIKKKSSIHSFINSLSKEFVNSHIRPYIEIRLNKCIDILTNSDIEIYLKSEKNYIYKDDRIIIEKKNAKTIFNFIKSDDISKYFLSIEHKQKQMKLNNATGVILTNSPCTLILNYRLYKFDDIDGKKLTPFFSKQYISIPKHAEKKYFETFVAKIIKNYKVNAKGFTINNTIPKKQAFLYFELSWNNEYVFIPKFKYNDIEYLSNSKNNTVVSFTDDNGKYIFQKMSRDKDWENEFIDFLVEKKLVHSEFGYKLKIDNSYVKRQHYKTINWLYDNINKIEEIGFNLIQNIQDKKYNLEKPKLDLKIKNKIDWFDVDIVVQFGKFKIAFSDLKKNIIEGIKEFILPDDSIAIIPDEWFEKYSNIFLFGKKINKQIQLKKYHFGIIKEYIDGSNEDCLGNIKDFSELTDIKIEIPQGLNTQLRSYQKTGYSWMKQLEELGFGACLADDMGLGKTIQTICLILYSSENKKNTINKKITPNKNDTEKIVQPSLFASSPTLPIIKLKKVKQASIIVMPVSLIYNWENEIKKFAPSLTFYKHTGSKRIKNIDYFDDYDIILTSYGLIRNDYELLSTYNFFYIILDESQYIKNPKSKIYKALKKLNSKYKITLTGTPIENSLSDLWSQMNFLNEGVLGNMNFFKKTFISKIEKENDEKYKDKLKTLIQPFILRRTKTQVLKELPSLTEQTLYCTMTENQIKYYETEKSKVRNAIQNNYKEKVKSNISFYILQALNKLRQIACHPSMIDNEYKEQSGKFNEIIRNIESLVSENHKVLVFSSFVKHLNLLKKYFEENNLNFSMLTGSTRNRKEIINEFENNINKKIFLISIKAGGVGLNLTSADYVFIIDPWWNPAIENQAVSRAHRIGQKRKVNVYRYISEKTIEEKIMKLKEKKSELAQTFINSNNPFKEMDIDNIMDFFD